MQKDFLKIIFFVLFPSIVLGGGVTLEPPITHTSIPGVLEGLTNFFFTLALYLLPIIIVIGGIFFVTAAGNPEKIETGKKIIILGIIGFVILLTAAGLIALIREGLGVRNP